MWEFDRLVYAYVAIGASLALTSLVSNWSNARSIKPISFLMAHVFWPISFGMVLFLAALEP
jgi:hypothetical protein